MSTIPFENHTICDVEELFGRKVIFDHLLNSIDDRHDNYNIVGCRRFGKTCLLESLVKSIRNNTNSKSIPIYIDSKSWNIGYIENGTIGTPNVYKYLLAILLEELTIGGFIKEDILIRDLIISPVSNRHTFYKKLSDYNSSSIADTFADAIRIFSSKLEKTFVFLFDEYEFLMTKAFSEPTGFQTLRKLSTETYNSIRPFSFVVAGAVTWRELCGKIGSKELNPIGSHIKFIKPLKFDDFKLFWNNECNKIEDEGLKGCVSNYVDFAYELSGGVPFHANDIGSYLVSNEGEYDDDYYAVIDEILESLTDSQQKMLIEISQQPNTVNGGSDLIYLRHLGLVKPEEMKLTIGLLQKHIQDMFSTNNDLQNGTEVIRTNEEECDIAHIINEVKSLRKRINHDWTTRQLWNTQRTDGRNYPPFKPSVDDLDNFDVLKKICHDRNDYNAFSGALYAIYYEGSSKGFNLPYGFSPRIRNRNVESQVSIFAQLVMANRHVYGGHVDYQPTEVPLSAEDVYQHINNGNEPLSKEDFKHAQKTMLCLFKDELRRMFEYLQSVS